MPIKVEDLPLHFRITEHGRARKLAANPNYKPGEHWITVDPEAYIIRTKDLMRNLDRLPKEWREFVYETGMAKLAIDWFRASKTVKEARQEVARLQQVWAEYFARKDRERTLDELVLDL